MAANSHHLKPPHGVGGDVRTAHARGERKENNMRIIRDNESFGIAMIPLFFQWGVKRCNVKDCTNKPSTIVTQLAPGVEIAGFCEKHYQESNVPGGCNFTLVFDDFDAFDRA